MSRLPILSAILLAAGLVPLSAAPSKNTARPDFEKEAGVGSWIWDRQTRDRQECRFWKAFEIPAGSPVKQARLRLTADNSYTVYLDGQPVGQGGDWYSVIDYDLSKLLTPGNHALAVVAANDFDRAGLTAGLYAETANGQKIWVPTDATWKIVPPDDDGPDWKKWTPRSRQWPDATVAGTAWWTNWPGIYQAAATEPEVIHFWEKPWFPVAMVSLCVIALAGCVFLVSRLIVQSHLEAVVGRERARIAADLHDDIGGGLTQLVLLGETIRSDLPPESNTRERVDSVCDQSRDLVRGMNETIWLINSQRDNFKDFAAYICKYAEGFLHLSPIRCRFDIQDDLPELPCDLGVRRNLFLAVKEALNNALKHSTATEVILGVHRVKNDMVISIADNGRGFDTRALASKGNGLENLKQRALDAGGRTSITSKPGGGCAIKFQVPLVFSKRKYSTWTTSGKRSGSRSSA